MTDTNFDQLRVRYRVRTVRRRATMTIGILILLAGYALLAGQPRHSV